MSNKKGGFGKFLGGLALGAGIGILLAPDKGENTRKALKKKLDELLKKLKEIDVDEVKDELLFKAEELQAELAELDTEKAKEIALKNNLITDSTIFIALKQAKNIKAKAEELYRYAIEKSTPVVEKAADEVRKQSLKVVKEIEKKLEDENKSKK